VTPLELNFHDLVAIAQIVLDDLPVGLLVLSAGGEPVWSNREAKVVCAVWNEMPLRRDALPLITAKLKVPPKLWQECQMILEQHSKDQKTPEARVISESKRGLHALIQLRCLANPHDFPVLFLQLDYRRPRGDRDRPLTPAALALMTHLTFREREVALRLRDGLATAEIARELSRSRLTIKTQLAGIYRKLGVKGRARVVAMLNR